MARNRKPKLDSAEENNFQDRAMSDEKIKGEREAEEKNSGRSTKSHKAQGKSNNSDSDTSKTSDNKPSVAIYTGAKNPIDMHSFNDAYLEPLGKLTTNLRNGYPELLSFSGNAPSYQGNRALNGQQPIGGVLSLPFIPTIGETADINDGVNLACVTLFNHVRAATGGTSYYEAPDLGLYNIALGNLYAYYAALIRIYGTVKSYAYDNIYVPEGIMYAHGINYKDIQLHIEDFRGWINLFAHKIMQFRLPAGFEYINRMVWMNSNEYLDSPLTNAQLYQFVQMSFYQLQEGISAHAYQYYYKKQVKTIDYDLWHLKLIPAPWATDGVHINGVTTSASPATTKQLIDFGEALLRPLTASQDIKYISAGYERAFQAFMEVNPISETFQIFPTYDESVLMQIENATFINAVENYGCVIAEDVNVNKGNLQSDLRLLESSGLFGNITFASNVSKYFDGARSGIAARIANLQQANTMLNLHNKTEFTPVDVMESSRLISYAANQLRLTYSSSDDWYQTAPVNSQEYNAGTQAQGWSWNTLQTYASNILFRPVFTVFRFIDATKPWQGLAKTGIELFGTLKITCNLSNLAYSLQNSIPATEKAAFLTAMQNIDAQQYLLEYAATLLSQWDWHPRWTAWDAFPNISLSGDVPVSTPTFSYLGQNMDVATYAMLGFDQLQSLNKYDMLSQFTNPQIGSYAVK